MGRHRRGESSDMIKIIEPIVAGTHDVPDWNRAIWIGEIDQFDLMGKRIQLADSRGYLRARLLVWANADQPRGFIEVPVEDGYVDLATVRDEVARLPYVSKPPLTHATPPISVVVCTRDRPDQLRCVLENLSALVYPLFELIVVDNNPSSGLTPAVVEAFDQMPVELVEAPGQGLSIARNAGIRKAKYAIIAFTDDDVVVDRRWLTNLARGFARNERVACVSGLVPSAELLTPAQYYFDRRVEWARRCEPAVYHLKAPPKGDDLFPLHVALYGTGANFAVRKSAVLGVGGFDEGLGVGSPAGGAEDIDMFVRILMAGYALVREPAAVVWHNHRRTTEELAVQIDHYGVGLGAWIAKLLIKPRTLAMVMRRVRPGLRHLGGVTVVEDEDVSDASLDVLDGRELKGVRKGPLALLRSRMSGRGGAPLRSASPKLLRALDFRRNQMWGDPGNTIAAGRMAVLAFALGLIGSLATIQVLPTYLLGVIVGVFMFGGPGALLMSWYTHLPVSALVALVPAVSFAVCLLVVTGLLMAGFYSPVIVLLGLSLATALGGLLRCGYLAARASRERVTS